MKQRRICKEEGCSRSLFTQNKSGYCSFCSGKHSEAVKAAHKRYAEKRGKMLVKYFAKALSLLREKHLEEFQEIYERLKDSLN